MKYIIKIIKNIEFKTEIIVIVSYIIVMWIVILIEFPIKL